MKQLSPAVLTVLFLVCVLPAIVSFGIKRVSPDPQPPYQDSYRIFEGNELTQSFISRQDRLSALAMSVRNYNLINKKDFDFTLSDEGGGLLYRSSLNGAGIQDGNLIYFDFPPIADSSGKTYSFILSAPSANEVDALRVLYSLDKDPHTIGLEYNQQEVEGSVALIYFYEPASHFSLIRNIYSGWIERFFQDRLFAVFYLGAIASLFYVIIKPQAKDK